jgi:hypothetical protein
MCSQRTTPLQQPQTSCEQRDAVHHICNLLGTNTGKPCSRSIVSTELKSPGDMVCSATVEGHPRIVQI